MNPESEQRAVRIQKLEALRSEGYDPFAIERYDRTHFAGSIVENAPRHMDQQVRIAGRITATRAMGKAMFLDVTDETGKIQVYVRRDDLGEQAYARVKSFDIGDIVGVGGHVFQTRTGETSIHAGEIALLAKCLRPIPMGKDVDGVKHAALTDVEVRHRHRYLDFIVNPESRDLLVKRSRLITAVRRFLDDSGFVEVETPVLQAVAGGAAARPFVTHHNALDADFKLRISLELPLKRLIVGGFPRVYEIGRVFRNEGVSPRHNPEFTLMELYQAYADLDDMMDLVERMYEAACIAVHGSPVFRARMADGHEAEIDLSARPWRRLSILDGIHEYGGVEPDDLADLSSAHRVCERFGIDPAREPSLGGIIEKLHEQCVQPHLVQPTFITDFPVETSPLAKRKPGCPHLTRRFEVYMATQELGNAFSEMNDPIEQRARFEDQVRQHALGNEEAHPMDEDFLMALEYGMPPTGGLGVGMDRLAMVLTGITSIKEVIAFPLVRPDH
ncbi:MAG: lysine--tRNA ligase [Chthonomonadales bacterium]|nr:lysine--tRNA ligase [Chthonomonadales bacterium]